MLERPVLNMEIVALGNALFHDPGLSGAGDLSCASCHAIERGGDDDLPTSLGAKGARTAVNSPTVLNSGLNLSQFWDGRAATLEIQVGGPITAPGEMNSTWAHVLEHVRAQKRYQDAFRVQYPTGITQVNIEDAIATFERYLVTEDSRFDRFLKGDTKALSAIEREGYALFKSSGCVACHQGMNVGGNMYQKFGVVGSYFKDRGGVTDADLGRYHVTKREEDKHVFRVPSLRNVARTAPYFHDGSAATLKDAIQIMGKYQLGRQFTPQESLRLEAFLGTLTGTVPELPTLVTR